MNLRQFLPGKLRTAAKQPFTQTATPLSADRDLDAGIEAQVQQLFRRRLFVSRRPPGDDWDDGIGVPVPTGPRPRRGGAQAKPPALPDEEFEERLLQISC